MNSTQFHAFFMFKILWGLEKILKTIMGFFNFNRKVKVVHQTFGHVEFHCKMRVGKITIICRTMPLKKQVVLIPMFDTRIGKFVDLGYGEKDLRDDLDDIIRIIGSKDMGQDAFFYAFDKFIIKHIDKYGRLIDTDLFRMVAEIMLIMAALSTKNNIIFNDSDRIGITRVFINRALDKFPTYYYVTRYDCLNLRPYLEKYAK